MAANRPVDGETLKKTLEAFLKTKTDVATVNQVEQRLELHVTNTDAYIPSYTRQVMDAHHGAPVMAIHTKTDPVSKKVFLYPADNPHDKAARILRGSDTMGPAFFAFGVPLRTLRLKLPASRRVILPLNTLEVPDHNVVYWASFAEIETEVRKLDTDQTAAGKQEPGKKPEALQTAKPAPAPEAETPDQTP